MLTKFPLKRAYLTMIMHWLETDAKLGGMWTQGISWLTALIINSRSPNSPYTSQSTFSTHSVVHLLGEYISGKKTK